jgi:hypothetical protein
VNRITVTVTREDSRFLAAVRDEVETLHAQGFSEDAIGHAVDLALRWGSVAMTARAPKVELSQTLRSAS